MRRGIGVASPEEVSGIESGHESPFERSPIGDGTCGRAVAVNPVGARAQHGNGFIGNCFDAAEHERRVSTADAISGHRTRKLATSDDGYGTAGCLRTVMCEPPEQLIPRTPKTWTAQAMPMYRARSRNIQYEHSDRVRGLASGGIGAMHRLA